MDIYNLIKFKKYELIEKNILDYNLYDKFFLLMFLNKKGKINNKIRERIHDSYYKIKSLNNNILIINTTKYEEIIAHIGLNLIFNNYSPSKNEIRIIMGIGVFAYNNKEYRLLAMISIILYTLNYNLCINFNNVSTSNKYKIITNKIILNS